MELNLVAVFASAVAATIIGSIWYSPTVFGTYWMDLMGFKKADMAKKQKEGMAKEYALSFLSSLIMSYVLGYFVRGTSLEGAAATVFWVWFGFVATIQIGGSLWGGQKYGVFFLNAAYWLITLLVMGSILSQWG